MFRSPFNKASRQTTPYKKSGDWKCGYHTGVDRVCNSDKTIVAIADGVVQRVNDCGASYGNHIVYRTNDGIVVLCAHMVSAPTLKKGEKVKRGQKLGVMGSSGNSYGAHLHIELQKANVWGYAKNLVDPNKYIDWNDFGNGNGDEFEVKKWKNGSTPEPVYQSTKSCKAKTDKIDNLQPRAEAMCTAIVDSCYMIYYTSNGNTKCGFVRYHGGVK